MPKWVKYILTTLVLIVLFLGSISCSLSLPGSSTTTTPGHQNNSSEYINPGWTFPPTTDSSSIPLPDFPPVIAKVMPAVVAVTTEIAVSSFFAQYTQFGAGSGVIIDADEGYVVTNNHVVEDAESIQVELYDGRTSPATIVGVDAFADLAVLKIDVADLPYALWGDSSQLHLGNWVIAIGNALGEGISASEGIVSRLDVPVTVQGSTLRGLIQTTAPINPGNSGGPLVNMAGQVIGITSAKMATVGVEGMGYAISTNSATPIIERLVREGHVIRPWLGVSLNTLSIDKGALIWEVVSGSPADAAGLESGDIIIHFKDIEITNTDDLVQAIQNCDIGEEVEITFVRDEDTKTTRATLRESPPPWS